MYGTQINKLAGKNKLELPTHYLGGNSANRNGASHTLTI